MIRIEGPSADAVWRQAADLLRQSGVVQEGRDEVTRELLHVSFTITDPRQRLVFARAFNPAFAVANVIWIMSGANDVEFLSFWNPRMRRYADGNKQVFHGAYGYRLGVQSKLSDKAARQLRHQTPLLAKKVDQVRSACEALRLTPHSRQIVLQTWDYSLDLPNPLSRSIDVPCNIMSHIMIRKGKLEWLQVMRSNDLMWGTPVNFIEFTMIQEIMAGWLGVEVGTYNHVSDSLHVYKRHWVELDQLNLVQEVIPRNDADLRLSFQNWEEVWTKLVDGAIQLTQFTEVPNILSVSDNLRDLPSAYVQWIHLLTAETLRRRGFPKEAEIVIKDADSYWRQSWQNWATRQKTKLTPSP